MCGLVFFNFAVSIDTPMSASDKAANTFVLSKSISYIKWTDF